MQSSSVDAITQNILNLLCCIDTYYWQEILLGFKYGIKTTSTTRSRDKVH